MSVDITHDIFFAVVHELATFLIIRSETDSIGKGSVKKERKIIMIPNIEFQLFAI